GLGLVHLLPGHGPGRLRGVRRGDARRRESGPLRYSRGGVRADRWLPRRVLRNEVRADPARGIRPHNRHVVPGCPPLPGRVVGTRTGLVGFDLVPAEGHVRLPARDLGALEFRADPRRPDPCDLVEAPAPGKPPAVDGHRGSGGVARREWWITARAAASGGSSVSSARRWAAP